LPGERDLQPIHSARAEDNLCASFGEHNRNCLTVSTARAGDDGNLVFDARHKVSHF
jgi:hypothetical protein